jgi:hypothetical protein
MRRGVPYTEVGGAQLVSLRDVVTGTELVIYTGDDGRVWARPLSEFLGGHFEEVVAIRGEAAGSSEDLVSPVVDILENRLRDMGRSSCPFCGLGHTDKCYLIRAFEYHPDGELKRIEFFGASDFDLRPSAKR